MGLCGGAVFRDYVVGLYDAFISIDGGVHFVSLFTYNSQPRDIDQ